MKNTNQKEHTKVFVFIIVFLKYYLFLIIFNDIYPSRQCEFHAFVRTFITLLKPRQKFQRHKSLIILQ